jgi:hypothetical protein
MLRVHGGSYSATEMSISSPHSSASKFSFGMAVETGGFTGLLRMSKILFTAASQLSLSSENRRAAKKVSGKQQKALRSKTLSKTDETLPSPFTSLGTFGSLNHLVG